MENNDILEELIGLDKQSAFDLCKVNGYDYRIIEEDSILYVVTCDFRLDRIDFIINDGKVTDCNIG